MKRLFNIIMKKLKIYFKNGDFLRRDQKWKRVDNIFFIINKNQNEN